MAMVPVLVVEKIRSWLPCQGVVARRDRLESSSKHLDPIVLVQTIENSLIPNHTYLPGLMTKIPKFRLPSPSLVRILYWICSGICFAVLSLLLSSSLLGMKEEGASNITQKTLLQVTSSQQKA